MRSLAAARDGAAGRWRWRWRRGLGLPLAAGAALFVLWTAVDTRPARDAAAPQPGLHAQSPTEAPQPLDVKAGRRLLAAYQCGACHRISGVSGAQGTHGPALVQWGQRIYIAGRVPNTPALLAAWIVHPQHLVPGTPMPNMGVTQRDAEQMAAYLLQAE